MADYSDIIDEFETVADAFTSVNYFRYDKVSEINGKLRDKDYPLILIKDSPNTSRGDVNNSFLPRNKKYTLDIFCYNSYKSSTQKTTTKQKAQALVDLYLDQYLAKVFGRNIEGSNGFSIVDQTQINGFLAKDVHNDKLIAAKYSVVVQLDSSCVEGTFNF